MLAEMDGIEEMQSVVVIGATNRPTLVDPALLRPGRLDELIYVGTPDKAGREHILGSTPRTCRWPRMSISPLAERDRAFTGADLEDLVRRAGLVAIRKRGEDAADVRAEDFDRIAGRQPRHGDRGNGSRIRQDEGRTEEAGDGSDPDRVPGAGDGELDAGQEARLSATLVRAIAFARARLHSMLR